MAQDLNYTETQQQMGKLTYKCNASNDFIEKRGDDGSFRWTSISFLFSTKPLRIIFCRSDLSAGETGASSVVLSSGKSPAPTSAFGLPLRIGLSFVVRLILSTWYHKKKLSGNVLSVVQFLLNSGLKYLKYVATLYEFPLAIPMLRNGSTLTTVAQYSVPCCTL